MALFEPNGGQQLGSKIGRDREKKMLWKMALLHLRLLLLYIRSKGKDVIDLREIH